MSIDRPCETDTAVDLVRGHAPYGQASATSGANRPRNSRNEHRANWSLLASPAAVGLARDLVERQADAWGMSSIGHDLSTVVGELASNAVEVSPNDVQINVQIRRDRSGVVVGVWDATNAKLNPCKVELTLDLIDSLPEEHEFGGWGLSIVERLCDSTGVNWTPPSGKWVWGRVSPTTAATNGPRRDGRR